MEWWLEGHSKGSAFWSSKDNILIYSHLCSIIWTLKYAIDTEQSVAIHSMESCVR